MDISEVMHIHRTRLGLSQAELAKAAEISLRQISRYEAGGQQPTLSAAVRLAEVLGISLNELAGLEPFGVSLHGDWFVTWETGPIGSERLNTHPMKIVQRSENVRFDVEQGIGSPDGDFTWMADLQLHEDRHGEGALLMGAYRSTDTSSNARGTIFLALTADAKSAIGTWTGHNNKGGVATGTIAISQNARMSRMLVQQEISDRTSGYLWRRRFAQLGGLRRSCATAITTKTSPSTRYTTLYGQESPKCQLRSSSGFPSISTSRGVRGKRSIESSVCQNAAMNSAPSPALCPSYQSRASLRSL